MVEGVWGSRKEGGNDLLLLREKKTQLDGLGWVERAWTLVSRPWPALLTASQAPFIN